LRKHHSPKFILQLLVNVTSAQTIEDLIQSVFHIWLKQFWTHSLLIIAFAFIFLLPINGLFYFCKCCCCNYGRVKRKDTKSFEILPRGYLILLIGMQAVMIGSLLLSLQSIDYTLSNINNINKFVQSISEDAVNVTEIIFDDAKCEMEMTLQKLFQEMKYLLRQLPSDAFNCYSENEEYAIMQSAINDLKNISWTLNKTVKSSEKIACDIRTLSPPLQIKLTNLTALTNDIIHQIHHINKHYNNVYQMNDTWNSLDNLKNILEESNATIDDAEKETMKMVGEIYNRSVDVIKFIRKMNQKMDSFYKDGNCSIAFNCGRYFGLFILAGAFLTGWIIMLIASLSFAVGYSIEAFCNPLFYDPEMRFFKTSPLFQVNIKNPIDEKIFKTDIGNIIKRCKDDETILSVLEIDWLINTNKMDIEEKRDRVIGALKNTDFRQHFPEQFFNQLREDSEQLKVMNVELHNFVISDDILALNESLRDKFTYMNNNVSELIEVINHTTNTTKQIVEEYLYSGEMINKSIEIIVNESNYIIADITEYIYNSTDYLRENSYNCGPLHDIWQDAGLTVSQKIGRPIQGLWVSAGLLALSFVPIIVLTAFINNYFVTTNRKWDLKEVSTFFILNF
uniref:PRM1A protein n=1 Tax=Elaeophora elaphi TaxID=1147741 RepID=A0A0R3RLB2_9BILA